MNEIRRLLLKWRYFSKERVNSIGASWDTGRARSFSLSYRSSTHNTAQRRTNKYLPKKAHAQPQLYMENILVSYRSMVVSEASDPSFETLRSLSQPRPFASTTRVYKVPPFLIRFELNSAQSLSYPRTQEEEKNTFIIPQPVFPYTCTDYYLPLTTLLNSKNDVVVLLRC